MRAQCTGLHSFDDNEQVNKMLGRLKAIPRTNVLVVGGSVKLLTKPRLQDAPGPALETILVHLHCLDRVRLAAALADIPSTCTHRSLLADSRTEVAATILQSAVRAHFQCFAMHGGFSRAARFLHVEFGLHQGRAHFHGVPYVGAANFRTQLNHRELWMVKKKLLDAQVSLQMVGRVASYGQSHPGSPTYWWMVKKKLEAQVKWRRFCARELPLFFMTGTVAEYHRPEVRRVLAVVSPTYWWMVK
jgi:hypothetical protein